MLVGEYAHHKGSFQYFWDSVAPVPMGHFLFRKIQSFLLQSAGVLTICFFLVHSGPLERGEQGGHLPSPFPLQILGKLTANLFHKNNLNYWLPPSPPDFQTFHRLCVTSYIFLPSKKCFSATRVVHNKTNDPSQNNVKYILVNSFLNY